MTGLTHFDPDGNAVMVDVTAKSESNREAVARGSVFLSPATIALIQQGDVKKGDVLSVAQLAGIMGAKRTADLIPLCHPLALTAVEVSLDLDQSRNAIDIAATCRLFGRTGVEMEALTAVAVAALTVYDMCKSVDRGITIGDIRLTHKSGGRTGELVRTMITVEEASRRILQSLSPVATAVVPTAQALGYVLADTLTARLTQPPAAMSAMDGYALSADDLGTLPVQLRVVGTSAAGNGFAGFVASGEAVRIFTGAPIPDGADTVVMQEDTEEAAGIVTIKFHPGLGGHIRAEGTDFTIGQPVLQAGTRLTARHLALAAAMNHPWVKIHRRPQVAILATGDEVVLPGDPIGPHQIASSNSFLIAALIEAAGGVPIQLGLAGDTIEDIQSLTEHSFGADLLVTIGGASVGDYDFVQKALAQIGMELDFWKLAMKPGKPLMFGHLGQTAVLGLPGNPVSAFVCSLVFLIPALERLQGLPGNGPLIEPAIAGATLPAAEKRQEYLRAHFSTDASGNLTATPDARQDSSLLTVLAAADGLILRRPYAPVAKPGDPVSVIRFGGLRGLI